MSRMMTIDVSGILEKYASEQRTARGKADEIVARVTTEDRAFTDVEQKELTELQDKIVELGKRSDLIKRQAEVGGKLEEPGKGKTQRENGKPGGERAETDADGEAAENEKRYAKAFGLYIRSGMGALSDEQRSSLQRGFATLPADAPEVRDMSAVTGQTGGFTVPQGFITNIEVAMKDFSGIRKTKATIMPTGAGNDIPYPTVNDTNNEGEQVEENQATTQQDPTGFGQVMFKSYLFSSKLVLVPIQLLQDTVIPIEGLLARLLGERLGRITNRRFTSGTGANQPQGMVTGSVLGKTAAGGAAVTYDELVDLQHSVDPAYRQGAEWMFHDLTFAALRKLKDSDGRPIWMPAMNSGMAGGAPGLLMDAPYAINNHMDVMASGKKSILWGQMSKYHIREVRQVVLVRLAERYAEKFQVGFFAFLRADGRIVDAGANPIKHLVHP